MRLGTVGLGRIGEALCPTGFEYSEYAQICLPAESNVYVDPGVVSPKPPVGVYINDLLNLIPKTTSQPATVGYTGGSVCPTGFTLLDGVCLPSNSPVVLSQQQKSAGIIPGVPNWAVYGGIGLIAFMALMKGKR